MNIDIIVGARPNFIKVAPLIHRLKKNNKKINYRLIHTGQHYDDSMSNNFFKDLSIPKPNHNLNCKSGSQSEQTAKIMIAYEKVLLKKKCDLCVVVGDVNSTMACAIAAKKIGIKVAHIESGLRSKDRKMPEEINRIITDSISDYFFTTSRSASNNLIKEGKDRNKIFFVGNLMIDSLFLYKNLLKKSEKIEKLINKNRYIVLTIHRVENVKNFKSLLKIISIISSSVKDNKIIFPVHPRIKKDINKLKNKFNNIIFVQPQPYLNFIYLIKNALAIVTDSGGITEEASILNIPCLTLRNSTERPETILKGTNELVGVNEKKIKNNLKKIIDNKWKKSKKIEKWDGKTSERIYDQLINIKIQK